MGTLRNSISFWFGAVMVLVVTGLAIAMAFTDMMSDSIYGNKRIIFILLLVAYAVYRGYRLYMYIKPVRRDEI